MNIKNYIAMARPNHWFKNLLMLPGTVVALMLTNIPVNQIVLPLLLGVISTCLIASANYVLNEWVDAEFDRFHPYKKDRPAVSGRVKAWLVGIEYLILVVCGLTLGWLVSRPFFLVSISFLVISFLYNLRPFRTKDKIYLDVLSESINNPIRLLLGWYIVPNIILPPASLVFAYWMGGAFLMNIKRYAELRFITDSNIASSYRRSFRFYTQENLLLTSFFYGMSCALFLGVFLLKHRIELLLGFPFLAVLFTWYLHIGMKPHSNAQNPERLLYKEKAFTIYVVFVIVLLGVLLLVDVPWLHLFIKNTFIGK